jgi:ribosomal protein S12 methylthiotransferase accessory factor
MMGLTRMMPAAEAVSLLRAELGRHEVEAVVQHCGGQRPGVSSCQLRDRHGNVVADASGYGEGAQADASAMFEAWQHHEHRAGFAGARRDPKRVRVLSPIEILVQGGLDGDAVVAGLARDYPGARVACLRFLPLPGMAGDALWYPAFARFPWFRRYPVAGDGGYDSHLKYATAIGTAAGVTEDEARLAALTEACEGDAVSLALLDWHARGKAPRRVRGEQLPARVRELLDVTAGELGGVCLFDVTADDLNVPAFIAVPGRPGLPGVYGEGASLSAACAAERALGEMMQAHVTVDVTAHGAQVQAALARLGKWPVIAKSAAMDPEDLAGRAVTAPARGPQWWDGPDLGPPGQLAEMARVLSAAGFRAYEFAWNPGGAVPVTTVLVPGLETFFLSAKGIPVLPGSRGLRRAGTP